MHWIGFDGRIKKKEEKRTKEEEEKKMCCALSKRDVSQPHNTHQMNAARKIATEESKAKKKGGNTIGKK